MQFFPLRTWSIASSSSSNSEEEHTKKETNNGASLYLNVYDLTPLNNYLYWFGLGIFHSGIEAHGMEYGFGAHDYSSSGVFEVEPKSCPGFMFRRSVLLGDCKMTRSELRSFVEKLSIEYHGDTYHLITKNCNHFSDDVSRRLTGNPIPGWVNRLARLGSFCNCLLPESIQMTSVRRVPDNYEHSDNGDSEILCSFSVAEGSDDEGSSHHLLSSNADLGYLKDRPVRLAKEMM